MPTPNKQAETLMPPAEQPGAEVPSASLAPAPVARAEASDPDVGPQAQQTCLVEGAQTIRAFGEYDLLNEVGRGNMGVVYKAWQRPLKREVALKMIKAEGPTTDDSVQRFRQEAQAAAALDHPGIVQIFNFGEFEGQHFFSMAFVDGDTLQATVERKGPLPPPEAARILKAVAEAMDYAHQRQVIHRDLKPGNILIDLSGRPRITDFGLAKSLGNTSGQTQYGQVLGTPAYMAPEQAAGKNEQVGPPADIYALGTTLYYALTGQVPFPGASVTEVLFRVVSSTPVPPRHFRPDIPPQLEAICLKCMEKEPSQRYASAGEVARLLEEWIRTHDAAQPTPSPLSLATLMKLAVAAAIVFFVALVAKHWRDSRPTDRGLEVVDRSMRNDAVVPTPPATPPTTTARTEKSERKEASELANPFPDQPRYKAFPVALEMIGATRDATGSWRLQAGEKVSFTVKADRDAYIGIWDLRANGEAVQLFPNRFQPNNRILAGEVLRVPDTNKFDIFARLSQGADRVWVVASTEPWDLMQGQQEGPIKTFSSQQGLRRDLEVVAHQDANNVAEAVLTYKVLPADKSDSK